MHTSCVATKNSNKSLPALLKHSLANPAAADNVSGVFKKADVPRPDVPRPEHGVSATGLKKWAQKRSPGGATMAF